MGWNRTQLFFFIKKIFLNVYLFLRQRETEHEWGRGRERERETQNQKQAPGSEPSAQSLTRGSNSRTMRSWPELKSDAQPTETPRRPTISHFKVRCVNTSSLPDPAVLLTRTVMTPIIWWHTHNFFFHKIKWFISQKERCSGLTF